MHELVLRIKEYKGCYVFAQNAIKRGHADLAIQAYRHAVDLRAADHEGITEAETMAMKSFYAYEETISYGQKKRKRATGTWQMVNKFGILPTLDKRLQSRASEEYLPILKELKMEDYSFQAVAEAYAEDLKQAA
jgi:hypothetical protein